MAGVVVCRDSSVTGRINFKDCQSSYTPRPPSASFAFSARGSNANEQCQLSSKKSFAHKHVRTHSLRGAFERHSPRFGRMCKRSSGRMVSSAFGKTALTGSNLSNLKKLMFSGQQPETFAERNSLTKRGPRKSSVLESSKAEGVGSTQASEEDDLTVDAEWEDLDEGEIDAAIAEISAEVGYDVSGNFQEGETEELTVEEAVASLPVGLMDRSREVREYYEQKERKRNVRSEERPSIEELRAKDEAALVDERREAAMMEEAALREERREAALREEEEAVYSAGESDDEDDSKLAADWKSQSQEDSQPAREVPQEPRLESTSQDIRTVPIDEFGEPVWDYQPEKEADPEEEEKYQMKADALPPDLLEHLKKARDRKAERDTEVIEVGFDQVYGQQVPKWRKEIEAKEKAQKERERTQLEDYVFRKKLFSYVEKKGVKVNETRHMFDDEGREIARDGKPLNDLNVAEAKLDAESAEREAAQAALPDWEAPYEPFPDDEYSDSEDEVEGDQETGSVTDVVAETAQIEDQEAGSVDEMREKLEERFRKLGTEEGKAETSQGFEALAGESSSPRSGESADTLSEDMDRKMEAESSGRTQEMDTESEASGSKGEKSPWEKSTLPVTHLKDHEQLGVDWGKEDYEDCFSDDEEAKNADAESKEERKARLRAMHSDLNRRMSDGGKEKKAGLDATEAREDLDREDDMPSQAELKELAKELEAALPKVTYKQMESLQPVLQDFGLAEEPLSELLVKPGFGNFMSDQLSKRSGTLARRQIKFPVAAVGKLLKDKGLKGRNIGEVLAKWGENRTVNLRKELEGQNGSLAAEDLGMSPDSQPDSTSWLESGDIESGLEVQLDAAEESTESNAESEELKRQLGLSEASLQDLFKDGLLKKEDVIDKLKSQLSQLDNEEFWGAEAEPIPDDDLKKVIETTKLPPTDGPIRFEGDQMSQEETWQLAETDPFEQPLVPQVSSAEWEEITADPSPLVVEIFATWAGPCKTMAVEVAKLARTMGERIRVVKLNAENEKSLAAALRVANVPTIVFIRGHQVVMKLDSVTDLPGSDMVEIAEHIFFQGPFPECMKRAVDRQARR